MVGGAGGREGGGVQYAAVGADLEESDIPPLSADSRGLARGRGAAEDPYGLREALQRDRDGSMRNCKVGCSMHTFLGRPSPPTRPDC